MSSGSEFRAPLPYVGPTGGGRAGSEKTDTSTTAIPSLGKRHLSPYVESILRAYSAYRRPPLALEKELGYLDLT